MASAQSEDVARRGTQLYEQRLRALLEPTHNGQFIAIEPDSGDYFVGDTDSEVVAAARQTYPDRLPLVLRIGQLATYYLVSGEMGPLGLQQPSGTQLYQNGGQGGSQIGHSGRQ